MQPGRAGPDLVSMETQGLTHKREQACTWGGFQDGHIPFPAHPCPFWCPRANAPMSPRHSRLRFGPVSLPAPSALCSSAHHGRSRSEGVLLSLAILPILFPLPLQTIVPILQDSAQVHLSCDVFSTLLSVRWEPSAWLDSVYTLFISSS